MTQSVQGDRHRVEICKWGGEETFMADLYLKTLTKDKPLLGAGFELNFT